MKTLNFLLVRFLVAFQLKHGETVAQITQADQDHQQQKAIGPLAPSSLKKFDQLCPRAEDIHPCVCIYDDEYNAIDMDCSHVDSEQKLKQIFGADFPSKIFRTFEIFRNSDLKVLESGVLGDISFENFHIHYTEIEIIMDGFFSSSYNTTNSLYIDYNLQLSQFPSNDIAKLLHAKYISLISNRLNTIPTFHGLPNLERLDVSNNHATFSGDFQNIPNMLYLTLPNNNLSIIPEGFFKTGADSTNGVNIDLRNCNIVKVEPDSFLISPQYLFINLDGNSLTSLQEENWRPLFESGVVITAADNPLKCDCDLAWMFDEQNLHANIVNDATCHDGNNLIYIHQLDPHVFDSC